MLLGLTVLLSISSMQDPQAQGRYDLKTVPDIIYNDIDGVIIGARSFGNLEGTFYDGPNRIYAGIWLGTNVPKYPISYYLTYTTPVEGYTVYGNELSVMLESGIRTGYNSQKVGFTKRWQPGFNEFQFQELSLSVTQDILYVEEYRPFRQLWQPNWVSLIGFDYHLSEFSLLGKIDLRASLKQNVNKASDIFTIGTLELTQEIPIGEGFNLMLRSFAGLASPETTPEYLFGYSFRQPVKWLNNGITRAKGTIPNAWLNKGLVQVSGGANLRGYTEEEFIELSEGKRVIYHSIASVNTELNFPNFLDRALEGGVISDYFRLRSYLFFDAGQSFEDEILILFKQFKHPEFVADAGIGFQFSFNIPDYLGKDRGFALRYEMPLWLSKPMPGDNKFELRHLIGIGAVVSL